MIEDISESKHVKIITNLQIEKQQINNNPSHLKKIFKHPSLGTSSGLASILSEPVPSQGQPIIVGRSYSAFVIHLDCGSMLYILYTLTEN